MTKLKIFVSRTTWPISPNIGTMHPWVKRIKDCSNEEPFDSQKVDDFLFPDNQCYDLINSYVFIDLNCSLRFVIWPMGLLSSDVIESPSWSWKFSYHNMFIGLVDCKILEYICYLNREKIIIIEVFINQSKPWHFSDEHWGQWVWLTHKQKWMLT